jgi:hypothetical protein
MTPVHELMMAAKPLILEVLKDGGSDRDPTPEDVQKIETVIPLFCQAVGIKTADEALVRFFDLVYAGAFEGMKPQFPRALMESTFSKIRVEHPELWASAARQLGLTP